MDLKVPPFLVILIPLLLSHIWSGGDAGPSTASSPSPSPRPSPAARRPVPPVAGGGRSTLDPRQLTALQSIGLSTTRDPCAIPSPHDNATACDHAAPFRHLVSLRLANCSSDVDLPPTALSALSTLRSFSLLRCPIPAPRRLPAPLASSLRSFSCVSSLRRLSGVWLSRLENLTDLVVVDVPVSASGPAVVLSQMHHLRSLTISRANLSGGLPHHWHTVVLVHLDLSSNTLKGPIPSSISPCFLLRSETMVPCRAVPLRSLWDYEARKELKMEREETRRVEEREMGCVLWLCCETGRVERGA